jgi:Flp pilus assembly protein TadD
MSKIKFSLIAAFVMMGGITMAQSLQDGKKMLYYQRFKSAKEAFEKLVSANPASPEASYWLGQALIGMKNVPAAKEVYRKALETGSNGSNPLLLAGMGHVELLENKANDARQRFEMAISLTKGKDVNVLNAIGEANADTKNGDASYAIEKLKLATAIKGFKEPDVYINMGDAYSRMMDGGGAVTSYQNALGIDAKYAAAKYKIGKIYLTQGRGQEDLFLKYFTDAVTDDPLYSPAYYDLYAWYFFRDVNKAVDYFNKYKANADAGPALDYEEASLYFAKSDFQTAISKADLLLQTQGANADTRLYRLKGYSYDKLGDSLNALKNMETFFGKAREDQINPDNYILMANLLGKFPDKQAQYDTYVNKAIEVDTLVANKVEYATKASLYYKKANDMVKSADWLLKIFSFKPTPSKTDIYNAGYAYFQAERFNTSDSIFTLYKQKYADETYGYYWCFRSKWKIDSTLELGLPYDDAIKFTEIAEKDKVRNKNTLNVAYGYLAGYTANIKKDYPAAITYLDKMLELDPTNQDVIKNKEIIQKAMKGAPSAGGPAPPKSGGNNKPDK